MHQIGHTTYTIEFGLSNLIDKGCLTEILFAKSKTSPLATFAKGEYIRGLYIQTFLIFAINIYMHVAQR